MNVVPLCCGVKKSPALQILSGKTPLHCFCAAIPHRGQVYWIDDVDIANKCTFAFLMILFSAVETGQSTVVPMVSVPSRQ